MKMKTPSRRLLFLLLLVFVAGAVTVSWVSPFGVHSTNVLSERGKTQRVSSSDRLPQDLPDQQQESYNVQHVVRESSGVIQQAYAKGSGGQCQSATDLPPAMMERDVTWSESWPEMEIPATLPGQLTPAVHYVWCGPSRQLLFPHYLGLLSALRVLKPLKFYFHYTHNQPVKDNLWYNDWFEEFKQFVPVIDMVQMSPKSCGSKEMLKAIIDIMTEEGGMYLGEKVALAGVPSNLPSLSSWFAFAEGDKDFTRGVVYVKKNMQDPKADANALYDKILASRRGCVSVGELNQLGHGEERKCVVMNQTPNYPRDIWAATTTFGELARWFFYGRRAIYQVKPDPSQPIPRLSHFVRLQNNGKSMYQDTFSFTHFLSVMSSLYVGGFHHVYLHMDKPPTGKWWDMLKTENVTVMKLEKPNLVYQQKVTGITHFSDISRFNILSRYGGAYQDFDCFWTSRVPDDLMAYPTVISPAISKNDPWPDGLALGMLMARPGAPFLRHGFKGYRRYRGENYLYNAIMRSYRTYEHYPDTVRFDPHFKMFSTMDEAWFLGPEKNGGRDIKWSTETKALHLVIPKIWKSFESPAALRDGTDMIADVGRNILKKSGRMSILDEA